MGKFKEWIDTSRSLLKELLNDTNVDQVAECSKALDAIETEYEAVKNEAQGAKDKLVEYVGKYAFNDKPKDDTHTEAPKTLDELFEEEFNQK